MKKRLVELLDENVRVYEDIEKDIWNHPETALQEEYASKRQKEYLGGQGFAIKEVQDVPTGFVAEYGTGSPVIGILGEYDALPDMSQKVTSHKEEEPAYTAGHACGHNLIGTAGLAAVDAIRKLYDEVGLNGTIRYYGCPAEERYSGKIMMDKSGVFDDLDICLIWHPQDVTGISYKQFYSGLIQMKVTFSGQTGHSMAAKNFGGNALQGASLMLTGVQYMREYIWDHNRIHYYMEDTGKTANLLPQTCSIYFESRAEDFKTLLKIKERLAEIADGAAKMSGTTYCIEIEDELYSDLENKVVLDRILHNLKSLPPIEYTDEEMKFLTKLADTLPTGAGDKVAGFYGVPEEGKAGCMHKGVFEKDKLIYLPADDAGNVSRKAPFGTFLIGMVPMGMPMHCWQVTAIAGSSIGTKGMMQAAKVMAATVYDFMSDDGLAENAKDEFLKNK